MVGFCCNMDPLEGTPCRMQPITDRGLGADWPGEALVMLSALHWVPADGALLGVSSILMETDHHWGLHLRVGLLILPQGPRGA